MIKRKICCSKMTVRSEEEQKKLIQEWQDEGQIRHKKNDRRDGYCNDILISRLPQAQLNAFNRADSQSYKGMRGQRCKNGDMEVIEELVATLQKLMK